MCPKVAENRFGATLLLNGRLLYFFGRSKTPIRTQLFFSTTTIPATDWRDISSHGGSIHDSDQSWGDAKRRAALARDMATTILQRVLAGVLFLSPMMELVSPRASQGERRVARPGQVCISRRRSSAFACDRAARRFHFSSGIGVPGP
jgi:hypothetical protein